MNFKSLPQLLDTFKDEATCIKYYEKMRWNGKPICPHCSAEKPYKTNRGYKCSNSECYKKFTVKVGTIFENSKIPFRTWFAAMYLITAHKKGISSVQLSIDLNITQKTAWFVLHRIREMLKDNAPKMLGGEGQTIEVDETYIGGIELNKHKGKKRSNEDKNLNNNGSVHKPKKVVVGIIERDGKIVLKHLASANKKDIHNFIEEHIPHGTSVNTDEAVLYKSLKRKYIHNTINHGLQIYVAGDVHTQNIENFWSVLKRGIYGIYHQVSDKHLERYLNEFASRFNSRKESSSERFNHVLVNTKGRLLYKNLIAND